MINIKRVVVIGSGFGGIAAALRLKAKGHDVTIVEKQNDLGEEPGYLKKKAILLMLDLRL
jgi:phytoene desaturase